MKTIKSGTGITIEQHGILAIETTSLNEILRIFGDKIIDVKAYGGKGNTIDELDLHDVGAFFKQRHNALFRMKYNRFCVNLTDIWLNKLRKAQEKFKIEDASVSSLVVNIRDEELGSKLEGLGYKMVCSKDKDFVAVFVAEPCMNKEEKEIFMRHEVNKKLIEDLRFKYFVLNMKKFCTKRSWIQPPSRREFMVEVGNGYLHSPDIISQTIKKAGHLEEYGVVKYYKKGKEDTWVLVGIN